MFLRMDLDADGRVTREEYLKLWTRAFRNQDKAGDGLLDVIEFGSPVSVKTSQRIEPVTITSMESTHDESLATIDVHYFRIRSGSS